MRVLFWAVSIAVLLVLLVAAVGVGTVPLGPGEVWDALLGRGDATTVAIVRTLRLPRVALGVLVGASLGVSGGALQGTLRNALAEPYLLGVSGGAAVGAVTAAIGGVAVALWPAAAFAGAVAAVTVTLFVAHAAGRRSDPRVLLMAGVVVGAFANAAIMFALAGAEANTVRNALWWMMGSIAVADWALIGWTALYTGVGLALLVVFARDVDVLALGEDAAAGLGLDVERAGRRIFVIASLLAASSVAAAGLVGFVGLVVPHIVRAAGVRRHRPLLAGAAIVGAALVVGADLVARTVRAPAELPLGAVTALAGVPVFLVFLRRLA